MRTSGKLILIVEDSEDIRATCAKYLSSRGFRVLIASNGEEAVSKAIKLQPALIVMDISLPMLNGVEAIRAIKTHWTTKDIPVVIWTAYPFDGTEIKELGCDGFLAKPCLPAEMAGEVIRALQLDEARVTPRV